MRIDARIIAALIGPFLFMPAAFSSPPPAWPGNECPFVGLNIRGDTFSLAAPGAARTFVLFYNTYSCRDCFVQLTEALDKLSGNDTMAARVVLIRTDRDVFLQRAILGEVKEIFPSLKRFYFDSRRGDLPDPSPPYDLQGGLFGCFHVSRTPALLVLEDGEEHLFISNSELFPSNDTMNPVERIINVVGPRLGRGRWSGSP